MKSLRLVDPELRQYIEANPTQDLDRDRRDYLRKSRTAPPLASSDAVVAEELFIDGEHAGQTVRIVVHRPRLQAAPMPAVLHIHGGGYVLGSPDDSNRENAELAQQCGCLVASVDYRLAPETPFPGALLDCHAALAWLFRQAAALNLDPGRIAVKGESAGGGLAAALALKAMDEGRYPIAQVVMVAPMLDDRAVGNEHPFNGDFVWTSKSNRYAWSSYLGCKPGNAGVPDYASPARRDDLSGFPPAFIAVGALDLFFEQDAEFARRLNYAGVPIELHVYPGAYHSFHRAGETSVNSRLKEDCRRALASAFGAA